MSMRPEGSARRSLIAGIVLGLSIAGSLTAQNAPVAPTIVGTKIADGQAYATLVVLKHQPNPANNGRMILAFEVTDYDGIPIWESTDHGTSWQFVGKARDPYETDKPRCEVHSQPHLTEMPRTENGIAAGTVMLSASTVCRNAPPATGNGNRSLRLFSSADLGRSWSYRSTYAEGTAEAPVWEPHLLILDDGRFVEFYSAETHKAEGYNQLLAHKVSTDGGETWGAEIFDTAMKGGVERPGMVIVDRLPDRRYVYIYEDVAGPVESQNYLKFSSDGANWGDPESRGSPIQTLAGQYPIYTPSVFWFPIGGPNGVLVTTSRNIAGPGGDAAGNALFWNNNLGVGPWWQAPTPVQKIGNNRAGWTQAMAMLPDGRLLHISSSGTPGPGAATGSNNQILFNAAAVSFNRYEAENARQQGTQLLRDASMSNGGKARLGANEVGKLTFTVYMPASGAYDLAVNYAGIGFDASPRFTVNGNAVPGTASPAAIDPALAALRTRDLGTRGNGEHFLLKGEANLRAGENTIEIRGGAYALDIDYLEITAKGR